MADCDFFNAVNRNCNRENWYRTYFWTIPICQYKICNRLCNRHRIISTSRRCKQTIKANLHGTTTAAISSSQISCVGLSVIVAIQPCEHFHRISYNPLVVIKNKLGVATALCEQASNDNVTERKTSRVTCEFTVESIVILSGFQTQSLRAIQSTETLRTQFGNVQGEPYCNY